MHQYKDEPNKESLKFLRTRVSHKGNSWAYAPAPISILNTDQYVSNAMANALVRKTDPSKFITTTMQLQQQQSAMMDSKARTASNILKEPSTHTHSMLSNTNTNTHSSSYSSTGDDGAKEEGAGGHTLRVLDFHRYIHKDTFNTKLTAMIAKRKHPPQNRDADECRGPKWDTVT